MRIKAQVVDVASLKGLSRILAILHNPQHTTIARQLIKEQSRAGKRRHAYGNIVLTAIDVETLLS